MCGLCVAHGLTCVLPVIYCDVVWYVLCMCFFGVAVFVSVCVFNVCVCFLWGALCGVVWFICWRCFVGVCLLMYVCDLRVADVCAAFVCDVICACSCACLCVLCVIDCATLNDSLWCVSFVLMCVSLCA